MTMFVVWRVYYANRKYCRIIWKAFLLWVGAKLADVHVLAQVHGLGRADGPCRLRLRDLVRLHLPGQVSEGQQVSDGASLQAQ